MVAGELDRGEEASRVMPSLVVGGGGGGGGSGIGDSMRFKSDR